MLKLFAATFSFHVIIIEEAYYEDSESLFDLQKNMVDIMYKQSIDLHEKML